jgi:pilus assembly protein Flp/PilA
MQVIKNIKRNLSNECGQSLIEYLLLVAIMAIATMSVMKVVGQNVAAQYGNVARAIQGGKAADTKQQMNSVDDNMTRKRDMASFLGD